MARPPLFQRATVTRILEETADTRTYVLEPHDGPLIYQAGQFCTFKVQVDGNDLYRSYSMSSAPETDAEFTTTVKRVPGGAVSNWMHDNIAEGDEVELTRPAGRFYLRTATAPVLAFAGGSGITPIMSLIKSTLATTDRTVRLLCADRDRSAAIFDTALSELVARYPSRLTVIRHFDDEQGLVDAAEVRGFIGTDGAGDAYICGPDAFMDLVESALPGPGRAFSERFGPAPGNNTPASDDSNQQDDNVTATSPPTTAPPAQHDDANEDTVTIILGKKKKTVPRHTGETLLETARRAGLTPPFSCEAGNCGTCIATLTEGTATMRVNDALTDDEVTEGFVLTCQAIPDATVTVDYE